VGPRQAAARAWRPAAELDRSARLNSNVSQRKEHPVTQMYWVKRKAEKASLKQQLVDSVAILVKPLGFSRSGKVLYRKLESGNLGLIHFQFLSRQDVAEVRPSIGIASAKLGYALKPGAKRQTMEMHFGSFIRYVGEDGIDFPVRGDSSLFVLRTSEEAESAAAQIHRFMVARGITWLEGNSSDAAVIDGLKQMKGVGPEWAAILEGAINGAA